MSSKKNSDKETFSLPKTVSLFGTQKASHLRRIYGMIKASGAFISVIEWPRIPAFYPKFNFMLFSLSYCSDAKNSLSNFCTYSFICF